MILLQFSIISNPCLHIIGKQNVYLLTENHSDSSEQRGWSFIRGEMHTKDEGD